MIAIVTPIEGDIEMEGIAKTAVIHEGAIIGRNVTIKDYAVIHPRARIEDNVEIGIGSIIKNNVTIGKNTFVGDYCILGEVTLKYYLDKQDYTSLETKIGNDSIIRSHSIIYEDVIIGEEFQSGHRITIREATRIGKKCSVGTMCDIQGKVEIGNYVRLHSNVFVGQLATINDFVWIYPAVVLTNDPYPPMGRLKGVTIKEYAQVAASSVIMPGVTIGVNALVGAGSLVRKDVPDEAVVVGTPGKVICSVRDLRDDLGNQIYPWKNFLEDFRGYPWQVSKE